MAHTLDMMRAMPVATTLAGAAYITVIVGFASRPVRNWLLEHVTMPRPRTQAHLAILDLFRGLAALWVASFHAWGWWMVGIAHPLPASRLVAEGNKSVPLFVALSGFLIYRAVRPIETVGDLRRYYRNRLLRLGPLCVASALVMLAAGQMGTAAPAGGRVIAEGLMLHSLGYPLFANPPMWSLYVEVVFYVVAPMFVMASPRQAVIAASILLLVFSVTDVSGPREFELWKYFCVGVLASEGHRRHAGRVREGWALAILAVGLAWLALDVLGTAPLEGLLRTRRALVWPAGRTTPYTIDLAAAVGLILVGSTLSGALMKVSQWGAIRVLGAISFSLYIWHGVFIMMEGPIAFDGAGGLLRRAAGAYVPLESFRLGVMLPAFLFVAGVSFVAIERPFLRLRDK